jgi:hypothetical protein
MVGTIVITLGSAQKTKGLTTKGLLRQTFIKSGNGIGISVLQKRNM